MTDAHELRKTSFTLSELRAIKAAISFAAPYAERMSFGFAYQLFDLDHRLGEKHIVLRELDGLEGLSDSSSTKGAEQFKRGPLRPFWHKHFSAPRHLLKNVGVRWGFEAQGNRDLTRLLEDIARENGCDPNLWQKRLAYEVVMGGIQDRVAAKRTTGDWIIFGKHAGDNYYLALATHEEARQPEQLLEKLRNGSAAEFPFLF